MSEHIIEIPDYTSSGKRTGRRQLRGKPLLGSCQRAHISHNELPGVDACYGLTDWNPGVYNDECLECGALVWNVDCGHTCETVWAKPPAFCNECGARVTGGGDA